MINVFIAGGVLYAGVKTFIKHRPKKKTAWLAETGSQAKQEPLSATDENGISQIEEETDRHFTISSVSLGLSISGALVYPPLGLASVPLTVYTSIPVFEKAYEALFQEGRIRMAVVSSVAVIGTLATAHYSLASFIGWLHYYMTRLARFLPPPPPARHPQRLRKHPFRRRAKARRWRREKPRRPAHRKPPCKLVLSKVEGIRWRIHCQVRIKRIAGDRDKEIVS